MCLEDKEDLLFRGGATRCRKCNNIRNEDNLVRYKAKRKEEDPYFFSNTIKRYRLTKKGEEYTKTEKYLANKKKQADKGREKLKDHYIKGLLTNKGININDINNELIELQRIIIKTKRLCKTSKN